MQTFLVFFLHGRQDFRIPELKSVAKLYNLPLEIIDEEKFTDDDVFLYIKLPDETSAKKIASRCVLIKHIHIIYAQEKTYDRLLSKLKEPSCLEFMKPYMEAGTTFKFMVAAFGKNYGQNSAIPIMNKIGPNLPLNGKVQLKNPMYTFSILESYGIGIDHSKVETPVPPNMIYFGRFITDGARKLLSQYDLKNRQYIGTTSMTAENSFLVANQALAQEYDLVLDPFVGTGSLVVACAHHRAVCIGCDMDVRVLRGNDGINIRGNFDQYHIPQGFMSDLMRMDFAQVRLVWRNRSPILDAIVADPPYGLREGARKVGKINANPVPQELQDDHIIATMQYSLPELLYDLLDFAAQSLKMGGRLVYWFPSTNDYQDSDVPQHSCLKLVSNSIQQLSLRFGRRLITMEKVKPCTENASSSSVHQNKDDTSQLPHARIREHVLYHRYGGIQPGTQSKSNE